MDFILNLMSPAQLQSLVRNLATPWITGALAYATGKGWITTSGAAELLPLLVALVVQSASAVWGVKAHTIASQVQNIAQADPVKLLETVVEAVPDVKKIETTPQLAMATPSDKIVSKV